ncbi:DUF488 family protein [Methanolobus bombayensis]|uniref:DUF488 domain-containing protein n=1 Tax=Methanolobus bombayensis TaxID=38023 RepID=UPI001FD82010|nr:DUF488 domain-containing protein [Methanolobus bombayensis]MBP1910372.1 uncharacterized protein (DUF488 family) [Methanolobus bombayensis]
MKCYTIGYGNRQPDEFISILIKNGITHLVDIRRYPQSTFKEYDRESLESVLPKNGILYYHCEGVGGMRESTYVEYMDTASFGNSLNKLISLIEKVSSEKGSIVLMCAEKSPKGCHRHYLSNKLEEKGIEVIHLVEQGQTSLFNF